MHANISVQKVRHERRRDNLELPSWHHALNHKMPCCQIDSKVLTPPNPHVLLLPSHWPFRRSSTPLSFHLLLPPAGRPTYSIFVSCRLPSPLPDSSLLLLLLLPSSSSSSSFGVVLALMSQVRRTLSPELELMSRCQESATDLLALIVLGSCYTI